MSHFSITEINEDSWPHILRIQAEVYVDIEPESVETLRSKWINSPQCCVLCTSEQGVCAYLLAHAWHSNLPPKLYESAPDVPIGDVLFIHDLAVTTQAAGMGVGKQMVNHVLRNAAARGFRSALLVAVQNSVPFWQKFGFAQVAGLTASASYGADAQVMSLEFT